MRPIKKWFFACIVICLVFLFSSCSGPMPHLTVISTISPSDFDSVLIINDSIEITSRRSSVAWETYDVFELSELYKPLDESYIGIGIETALLRVTAHSETFSINIDTEIFNNHYNTIILNIRNN